MRIDSEDREQGGQVCPMMAKICDDSSKVSNDLVSQRNEGDVVVLFRKYDEPIASSRGAVVG